MNRSLMRDDFTTHFFIGINVQWTIIFQWSTGNAYKVEITDYH